MKKFFTLIAAAFVLAGAANAEPVVQKTALRLNDFFGEPVCTPFVVNISYENGIYTIDDFAGSGAPLSFIYDDSFNTTMTGDNFYSLDPENPECDDYGLRVPDTGENAILELKNYMDSGETVPVYSPTFMKSTCLVFEDEVGPYLSGFLSGLEKLDDPESLVYLDMKMYFKVIDDNNAVNLTTNDSSVEYFNLQGQPVENPDKGIFIRISNGKATKVAL